MQTSQKVTQDLGWHNNRKSEFSRIFQVEEYAPENCIMLVRKDGEVVDAFENQALKANDGCIAINRVYMN